MNGVHVAACLPTRLQWPMSFQPTCTQTTYTPQSNRHTHTNCVCINYNECTTQRWHHRLWTSTNQWTIVHFLCWREKRLGRSTLVFVPLSNSSRFGLFRFKEIQITANVHTKIITVVTNIWKKNKEQISKERNQKSMNKIQQDPLDKQYSFWRKDTISFFFLSHKLNWSTHKWSKIRHTWKYLKKQQLDKKRKK